MNNKCAVCGITIPFEEIEAGISVDNMFIFGTIRSFNSTSVHRDCFETALQENIVNSDESGR